MSARLAMFLILLTSLGHAAEKAASPAGTHRKAPDAAKSDADDEDDDEDDDDEDCPCHDGEATKDSKVSKADADDEADDDEDDADGEDDTASPKTISANVTLASDYVLRGLSQTGHQPALQGGFDWEHPLGFFLGTWGSNVHYSDSPATIELDWYGGYNYHFTHDLSASLGLLYYSYFADSARNSWMVPLKAEFKGFKGEVDYLPNLAGLDVTAWYFNLGWSGPVIWDVTLGGFAGYAVSTDSTVAPDYLDLRVSAAREFLDVEWEVSGVFVPQETIAGSEAGTRVIFSATKAF
jgi:uncharacterized protein (TIGR02001 family)